jgi:hypothetical protein
MVMLQVRLDLGSHPAVFMLTPAYHKDFHTLVTFDLINKAVRMYQKTPAAATNCCDAASWKVELLP